MFYIQLSELFILLIKDIFIRKKMYSINPAILPTQKTAV